MPDVFIDYRTGDGASTASVIEGDLSRRFGSEKIFRDSKPIRPGENYRQALSRGVASCRVLIAIIGPNWLVARDQQGRNALDDENDRGRREIVEAFEHGLMVIPILVGTPFSRLERAALPPALVRLEGCQAVRLDPGNPEEGLARLVEELTELVPGPVDRTTRAEQEPAGGSTQNTIGGNAQSSVQTGEYLDDHSGGTRTVISDPSGPVFSGTGDQNNGPVFGDGTDLIIGKSTGGIHQNFGSPARPEAER